ncbi:MAG TPA: SpoIID/LytB domain-containing protein [Candidatus Limnocylindrales bacterium]|nr:SpoIID/LytB domain-containing protein [Candidatus Limnocylindrales bacterium]
MVPSGHGRCSAATSSSVHPNEDNELPTHRFARPRSAIIPALLALAGVFVVPGGAAADDGRQVVFSRSQEITFFGRGWGHGVGMSQHGARGRALAGQTTAQILAHYYAGTTLGTKNPASQVRVLVLTGFAATPANPATIYGRGGTFKVDGIGTTFPKDAKVTLAPTTTGATTYTLTVTSSTGSKLHSSKVSGSLAVRPGSGTVLQLDSKPSTYDRYRGLLRVYLTTSVRVVNELGLDLYLRGVVPAEMPSTWPVEAVKAQAIAARSYAAVRLKPGTGQFDVYDDTRSQVYRGTKGEATATTAAITATSGVVLKSGSSIANALFHSTGGGATEHNEYVFVSATGKIVAGPVSYLRGSSDRAPDGTPYDAGSPKATWQTASYTRKGLSTIFGKDARTNVGAISKIDLSRRGVSGRLISVTLIGSLGTKTVSGGVFRSVFNAGNPPAHADLQSTLFDTRPIP